MHGMDGRWRPARNRRPGLPHGLPVSLQPAPMASAPSEELKNWDGKFVKVDQAPSVFAPSPPPEWTDRWCCRRSWRPWLVHVVEASPPSTRGRVATRRLTCTPPESGEAFGRHRHASEGLRCR